MANKKKQSHEYEKVSEFDRAMRKLVEVPKEAAKQSSKTPKPKKPNR